MTSTLPIPYYIGLLANTAEKTKLCWQIKFREPILDKVFTGYCSDLRITFMFFREWDKQHENPGPRDLVQLAKQELYI